MFHSVSLLGACPQPCGKHADTVDLLYYYFHIKEEHCKMYYDKIISEYTLKLTKLCHFKKFLGGTLCPLNIQYTERLNLLSGLQYHYVYIRNEIF